MYCDSSILHCFLLKLKTNPFRNLLYSYIFLNVYFVKISQTPSIWFKVKETILVWQRYPQKNHFVPRSQNVHSGFHARGRADAFKESSLLPCPGSQKPLLSTLQRDWSHTWFKAGLHTCWKGCVKRCRAVCSPAYTTTYIGSAMLRRPCERSWSWCFHTDSQAGRQSRLQAANSSPDA